MRLASNTKRRKEPLTLMNWLALWSLLPCAISAFSRPLNSAIPSFSSTSLHLSDFDFEYIPPNQGAWAPSTSTLPSVYPPDTPPGMRGEAVRAAIRSGRCIAWDLTETPYCQGLLQVQGKGTLSFLNNKVSNTVKAGQSVRACLLNAKGRVVDTLTVAALDADNAYMMTSPGHDGSKLFDKLDPLIFPMDEVRLTDCSSTSRILTLASISLADVQDCIQRDVLPLINVRANWKFPKKGECFEFPLQSGASLLILPTCILPDVACHGYTLVLRNDKTDLYQVVWRNLVTEANPDGPIEIGALEWDTLRIESGMPLYGMEMTGDDKEVKNSPSPLELCLDDQIDMSKGCYLGQEGVASIFKNPRGPPRMLYQVVFDDEENVYGFESEGDDGKVENLTKLPLPGQDLYVLGSNEQISVGTILSVAEPGGTGDPNVVALALIRRADSILKQMKEMDLEVGTNDPFANDPLWNGGVTVVNVNQREGPPKDPLEGLEVIIGGTYTMGALRPVPTRRVFRGKTLYEDVATWDDLGDESNNADVERMVGPRPTQPQDWEPAPEVTAAMTAEAEDAEFAAVMAEAEQAEAEADAAAAEAQRKADKLKLLKQKADEAMAKRRAKKTE
jgi:glycine cleavage system aminomethyltransferase T